METPAPKSGIQIQVHVWASGETEPPKKTDTDKSVKIPNGCYALLLANAATGETLWSNFLEAPEPIEGGQHTRLLRGIMRGVFEAYRLREALQITNKLVAILSPDTHVLLYSLRPGNAARAAGGYKAGSGKLFADHELLKEMDELSDKLGFDVTGRGAMKGKEAELHNLVANQARGKWQAVEEHRRSSS